MSRLDLIVPGLLGPFSADRPDTLHQQLKQPLYTALNRRISRADVSRLAAGDFVSTLHQLICPQCDLGLSEITASFGGDAMLDQVRYRIDPVHFRAESDHAILLGPELLELVDEESQRLVEAFNRHFEEDRVTLTLDAEGHWYLHYERPLQLSFTSLDEALGRDIKHFMPTGDDALWWRRIVNEAQMLFFQHDVNQQREADGRLSINGLWLWDRAFSPAEAVTQYQQLFSDHRLATSMAAQSSLPVTPLQDWHLDNHPGNSLMLDDSLYASMCYGDIQAWLEALQDFSENRFAKLEQALKQGSLQQLVLYPCDGRSFSITRRQGVKFWKPVRTLEAFFSRGE